ncbi:MULTISPECIES: zinc ABC transporter substrate-binding protein [unclassified Microcystis]|uniref:metal ABC transporter solute-binding protein, Zn/Mn family n=1 Tax=unclassified Microcystis TaxID=2643300 RepID=UPI0022BEA411|nr:MULTISPECIES: zinc ABC transporter substrate-binding protein [unclassified Microcystis]MCA2691498.1 zinc ABC transporter substrate-binding protein [Microcystis sp. M034S2]MCA2751120.1 zinc ABC transporter substrate-binding protein [Microcystis sp. M144S2]MCZ8200432.1 zinc ABC transporter substrate-binding protein [Microcystis sp. LE19-55.1A]MCZ8305729.1 zinc ABC transporter substrate-binding protein [Microcystis sp. LE19-98.1E]
MGKKFQLTAITLTLTIASLTACSGPSVKEEEAKTPLQVTVSIVPQEYFVKRIGGDRVSVNAMIQPGTDPHTYEPKPEQLKTTARSQAYFKIGVSLEDAWKDRLNSVNQQMLIVDTSQGVDKIPLTAEHDHDHNHDHNHDHDHAKAKTEQAGKNTLDPHIWLSPKRVKAQAKTIYQTLAQLDPGQEAIYRANLEKFSQELDALDQEIRQNLAGIKNKKFMVFHPEWGYFAQDYGLEMIAIEIDGNEPSAAQLSQLIKQAKKENIKVIFTQPEFSQKSAETIAREIGGQVIPISAFAENWSENLRQVSQKMATVLNQ